MEGITHLQIEPTTRCNFTCGFCCGRQMQQADISVETFEQALLRYPSVKHVELQGEGEPLMHPQFFDMLERCRRAGISVSFITNGSCLSEDNVIRILDSAAAVKKILISIESADPTQFRTIRGGRLEKVVAGIGRLVAARLRMGLTGPVVGFAVTVLRSTASGLPAIASLYRQLGMDGGMLIQPLRKMEAYLPTYDEAMMKETISDEEMEQLTQTVWADQGLRAAVAADPWSGFYGELFGGWDPAEGTCPWLERGAFVNMQGEVTACCTIKNSARYSFGNVAGVEGERPGVREDIKAELREGKTPLACRGCNVAAMIVEARACADARLQDEASAELTLD